MIIGISGKKRSGKDTAASALVELGYKRISFAGPLKAICSEIFNLDFNDDTTKDTVFDRKLVVNGVHLMKLFKRLRGELTEEQVEDIEVLLLGKKFGTRREILQFVGTNVFRNLVDDNIWINYAKQELLGNEGNDVVITDARYANERAIIKELGGILVLIKRDLKEEDTHISENSLGEDTEYDIIIQNNADIKELQKKILENISVISNLKEGLADASAGRLKEIDLSKSDWIEDVE